MSPLCVVVQRQSGRKLTSADTAEMVKTGGRTEVSTHLAASSSAVRLKRPTSAVEAVRQRRKDRSASDSNSEPQVNPFAFSRDAVFPQAPSDMDSDRVIAVDDVGGEDDGGSRVRLASDAVPPTIQHIQEQGTLGGMVV